MRPVLEFDLTKYRLMDSLDVVAGLDARPVLTSLSPTEFEHLVRQLFEAIGMEAWRHGTPRPPVQARAGHAFAAAHGRLRLIEGPELVYLIKEHLGKDVIAGPVPPTRRG